jgi:hypothetical protein
MPSHVTVAVAALTLASLASAVAETAKPCNCEPGVSFLAGEQTDKLLNDHNAPASSMPVPYLSRSVSSLQATFTALNATEPVEIHPTLAEQIFIVDGEGTLQVGGNVVDDKQVSPTERRGTSVTGSVAYMLTPHSLVDIPAGMPRWIVVPTGGHLSYLSFKEAK